VRNIKLEILRHGHPHNQLLSPLTRYMALCGEHEPAVLEVPFEHAQVLERLRELRYLDRDQSDVRSGLAARVESRRQQALDSLARDMGSILAQVPGLIADLADGSGTDDGVTQLRLVLSANELAILPFELAIGQPGFPGAGQPLTMQTTLPLSITREVRRVGGIRFEWPLHAKILFAFASPRGVAPVPVDAHLAALAGAIEPWLFQPSDPDDPVQLREEMARHLTILPQASIDDLTAACATGEYTHVHLLAHGVPLRRGDDRHFGVALHNHRQRDDLEIVEGDRLALALRTHRRDGNRELVRPAVVSLATCDSGNLGSVVGAGASVAHSLHAAGVPLVIASQFPLSVVGSIHLVRVLYRSLLHGEDPRLTLDDLRRQLRALVSDRHDWASIVAYASLPPNLTDQLTRVTFARAKRAIQAAMSHLDAATQILSPRRKSRAKGTFSEAAMVAAKERVARSKGQIDEARARLVRLLTAHLTLTDADRVLKGQIHGLLGSLDKRLAEFEFRTRGPSWLDLLRSAEEQYHETFVADRTSSWALVQQLALGFAQGNDPPQRLWELAWRLSENDLALPETWRRVWALNNLVELAIMGVEMPTQPRLDGVTSLEQLAEKHLRAILSLTTSTDQDVLGLAFQLDRYMEFFRFTSKAPREKAAALAERLGDILSARHTS
jgi:hypothetical protein